MTYGMSKSEIEEYKIFYEEKILHSVCQMAWMYINGPDARIEAAQPYRTKDGDLKWMIMGYNMVERYTISCDYSLLNPESEAYIVSKL
jgi:hypothetical protein